MTCPHCWTPDAQRLAALNAARVAHDLDRALLAHVAIVSSALRHNQDAALLARLLAGPTDAETPKPKKV